jgi:ribosomal protein L3
MSLSSLGLLGRKVGMMRLFTDEGDAVPVTVLDVSNNRVTQVKNQDNDGYVALQVTYGARKASRVTKPIAGHLAKAGVEAGEIIREFRVDADTAGKYAAGKTVQNLDVIRDDEARGLLMVKGADPGAKNGIVTVRLAAKGQPKPVAAPAAKAEKGKK